MTELNYPVLAVFALLCTVLLTLPFIPAILEWRRPSDVDALLVLTNYTSDIGYFSKRLYADVQAKLGRGVSTGFEAFDFVEFPVDDMDWPQSRNRLISLQSIDTPFAIKNKNGQPLFVEGDLLTGPESIFSSVYSTGDIVLGHDSAVHDWAHADGLIQLGASSVALRRVSAGKSIELGLEAWFERLNAPAIYFGYRAAQSAIRRSLPQQASSLAELPGAIEQTPTLFLVRGDCVIEAGKTYSGSLIVTGFLTIGQDSTVEGDIKARDGLSLGRRAQVKGAITCEKRIYLFKDARALGPVTSESDILIGARSVIGLPDSLTTVSALNIIVEAGATVHGAVWACEVGIVKAE